MFQNIYQSASLTFLAPFFLSTSLPKFDIPFVYGCLIAVGTGMERRRCITPWFSRAMGLLNLMCHDVMMYYFLLRSLTYHIYTPTMYISFIYVRMVYWMLHTSNAKNSFWRASIDVVMSYGMYAFLKDLHLYYASGVQNLKHLNHIK